MLWKGFKCRGQNLLTAHGSSLAELAESDWAVGPFPIIERYVYKGVPGVPALWRI